MGLTVKTLRVMGDRGQAEVDALFDTGARRSVVRREAAEALASLTRLSKPRTFQTADENGSLAAAHVVNLELTINGVTIDDQFYAIDSLRRGLIVGADTMQSWEIGLDPKTESITVGVDPNAIELM